MSLEQQFAQVRHLKQVPVCPVCKRPIFRPEEAPLPYCSEKCRDGKPEKPDIKIFPAGYCVICRRRLPENTRGVAMCTCSVYCTNILRLWDGRFEEPVSAKARCAACGIRIIRPVTVQGKDYCRRDCRLEHEQADGWEEDERSGEN